MTEAGQAGRVRVVIVDDAEDLRIMLRFRLGLLDGIELVAEAADGIEGVDAARLHRPDAVVLDLGMPRMDGLQAAAILREEFPDLLLIALTGYDRKTLGEQAHEAGFDHYLVKGTEISELERLLLAASVDGGDQPSQRTSNGA